MVDGVIPVAAKDQKGIKRSKKRVFLIITAALVVIALAVGGWLIFKPESTNDPFDAKTLASAAFPLYYPTSLPAGFHVDTKSVSQPQAGVVVFNLVGPKGQKIYMSQESRPNTFDFGGYYKNFSDLTEKIVADGTIAVGKINGGQTEIGSYATNKTWIIVNTHSAVPSEQLTSTLNSVVVAH